MDGVFIRFLRNLGIEDLSPYETCVLKKCVFSKTNNLLTVEIHSPTLLKYSHSKAIIDGLEKCNYQTQLTFTYDNPYDEERLFEILKDEFVNSTGYEVSSMPHFSYDKKTDTINLKFFGRLHASVFNLFWNYGKKF